MTRKRSHKRIKDGGRVPTSKRKTYGYWPEIEKGDADKTMSRQHKDEDYNRSLWRKIGVNFEVIGGTRIIMHGAANTTEGYVWYHRPDANEFTFTLAIRPMLDGKGNPNPKRWEAVLYRGNIEKIHLISAPTKQEIIDWAGYQVLSKDPRQLWDELKARDNRTPPWEKDRTHWRKGRWR